MTLPATVYDLPNLKADLTAKGQTPAASYQCPHCPRQQPPESVVSTSDLACSLPKWVCTTCASDPFRAAKAAEASSAAAAQAQADPWASEVGRQVRARRDQQLDAHLWTNLPGSPLVTSNQEAWRQWRVKMNRLTIDYATPALALKNWPKTPAYVYTPTALQI